jgi:hypothetical protein
MSNIAERLFLGDAQQNLQRIFDVQSLEQIHRKDQVVIPSEIFEKARADLALTISDGRERLTHFDIKEGQIKPIREKIGQPFSIKDGVVLAGVETGWLRAIYECFLAKPVPVHLRTHPILSESYLNEHNIETVHKNLSLEQSIALVNEIGNYLSDTDLGHMEIKNKFIRSMLLASNGGYTWVINPILEWRPTFACSSGMQYERDFSSIFNLMANRMYKEGHASIDSDRVNRFLLQKLNDFCYKKGFVGFYNRDKNSPELTTLRYLPF